MRVPWVLCLRLRVIKRFRSLSSFMRFWKRMRIERPMGRKRFYMHWSKVRLEICWFVIMFLRIIIIRRERNLRKWSRRFRLKMGMFLSSHPLILRGSDLWSFLVLRQFWDFRLISMRSIRSSLVRVVLGMMRVWRRISRIFNKFSFN